MTKTTHDHDHHESAPAPYATKADQAQALDHRAPPSVVDVCLHSSEPLTHYWALGSAHGGVPLQTTSSLMSTLTWRKTYGEASGDVPAPASNRFGAVGLVCDDQQRASAEFIRGAISQLVHLVPHKTVKCTVIWRSPEVYLFSFLLELNISTIAQVIIFHHVLVNNAIRMKLFPETAVHGLMFDARY